MQTPMNTSTNLSQQARINVVLFNGNSVTAPLYMTSVTGQRYMLERAAKRMYGALCLDDLADNEIVVSPGLIYRPVANS